MSEFAAPATLVTPWGNIAFNPSGGNGYYITNLPGLGQAPLRAPVDDKPQAAGAIVHPFLKAARRLTVEGYILPVVGSSLVTAMDNLVAALESIEQADGTWSWTPTGGSAKSLTVRCEIAVDFASARPKTFAFGLIAANPTIT